MSTPRFQITVRDRRSGATTTHRFDAPCVRIGRAPTSDLLLADGFVSHEHATIESTPTGPVIRDRGATNGVRVAGRRLEPMATALLTAASNVAIGPFTLEVVYHPDREDHERHGTIDTGDADPVAALHRELLGLRSLHATLNHARQAFTKAFASAVDTHQKTGDQAGAERLLAEFPGDDLPSSPPAKVAPTWLAEAAQTLVPTQRPPKTSAEAERLLLRMTHVLRGLAAGFCALQHLRISQASEIGLAATTAVKHPLVAVTEPDEWLRHVLSATGEPHDLHELFDGFAVLTAHHRAHVDAAISAARHLADVLAPTRISAHTTTPWWPGRGYWRTFCAEYSACIGDGNLSGTLHRSFSSAYSDAMAQQGVVLSPA